jgi:hypothetical protein
MSAVRGSSSHNNNRDSTSNSDDDSDSASIHGSSADSGIPRPSSSDPAAGLVETCQRWLKRHRKTLSEYSRSYQTSIGWKQHRNRHEAEMNAY